MIIPGVKRANTKVQIQNTQIHHMVRCQKDPTCGIFLKRGLFKGIKNYNPMCQTCKNKKCKYTNKQIHHMVKCQKDPSCGIFYYLFLLSFPPSTMMFRLSTCAHQRHRMLLKNGPQRIKGIEWIA